MRFRRPCYSKGLLPWELERAANEWRRRWVDNDDVCRASPVGMRLDGERDAQYCRGCGRATVHPGRIHHNAHSAGRKVDHCARDCACAAKREGSTEHANVENAPHGVQGNDDEPTASSVGYVAAKPDESPLRAIVQEARTLAVRPIHVLTRISR